jgi:probable F420-dependent oxidoreductase
MDAVAPLPGSVGTRTTKPFRFATQAFSAGSGGEWREMARKAEALGFTTFHVADHYFGPGPIQAETGHPVQELAAVVALSIAAAATERIRVGTRMLCVDYHLAATLAKEMATLDLLSDGRLELGLGAGWVQAEYRAMGIRFDPLDVRLERLGETVQLMKDHFSGDQINLDGKHVRVSGYVGAPRPVQRPRPKIMIGGGGRKVLMLAGREADIVSVNWDNRSGRVDTSSLQTSAQSHMTQKIGWIREGAGDHWDEIELEIGAYLTFITDHGHRVAERLAPRLGLDPADVPDYPHTLIGSVDTICERLLERRERYGFNYITIPMRTQLVADESSFDDFAEVIERLHGK